MNNIVDWLLEEDTPEIRYRTMTELLGMSKDDLAVKDAFEQLLSSEAVVKTVKSFDIGKSWTDYSCLSALAEFGLTRRDVLIDAYVERLIANTDFKMMCGEALLLRNLVALGYYDEPSVKDEIAEVFKQQKTDGGFGCVSKNKKINDPKLPHKSCMRITATYLMLSAELKKINKEPPQTKALVDYFLNRNILFRHDDLERYVVDEMAGTFYPLDPVKTGLQMIMYSMAMLGAAGAAGCEKAWVLLDSKKDNEGRYILDKALTKPLYKIGRVGKPNKWVTLYALLAHKYNKAD